MDSSNAFTPRSRILDLGRSLFARVAKALKGAAPRLSQPMYPDFLHGGATNTRVCGFH
jgi:hypothetical protein